MNPAAANKMIGISAVIVAGTISLAEVQRHGGLPDTRQFAALSVAYLLMSAASDLGAGGLGAGLALLLMISTVLVRGDDVLAYLGVRFPAAGAKAPAPGVHPRRAARLQPTP